MKKILVITSGRADYGLLYYLMRQIKASTNLELQIIATGMHMSPEFGMTYKKIEQDGFFINRKIEILLSSDSGIGVSKSMGLAMIAFSEAFEELKPNIIVVLGDRFEIFAAAATATVQKIPLAHLHGGEVTIGAIDDAFRHSITKMSNFHFCANKDAERRIIQLGENLENIFIVGGLGLDYIKNIVPLTKDEIEKKLSFTFKDKNILITYHPETLSSISPKNQVQELLIALQDFSDVGMIFTMPNADAGGREISKIINEFVNSNSNARYFQSLGHNVYLSCISMFDGVIGNSSSGILEVPSFKKGTVNIGNRQDGRLFASSVIKCGLCSNEIRESIQKLLSQEYREIFEKTSNPYGEEGASEKITKIIENINLTEIGLKKFMDYKFTKEHGIQ